MFGRTIITFFRSKWKEHNKITFKGAFCQDTFWREKNFKNVDSFS